jgi:hypothetical protein
MEAIEFITNQGRETIKVKNSTITPRDDPLKKSFAKSMQKRSSKDQNFG